MPQFYLQTNMPSATIPRDFLPKAVKVIAKALNRPEQLTIVCLKPDSALSFSGTTDLCAVATLKATGKIGVEENKTHSKVISDFVQKELGIPSNRMFINFVDESLVNIGFKGTTFQALLESNNLSDLLK